METFVARQPILDQAKNTIGYEILFRDGINNAFPETDGDIATVRIIVDTFLATGSENLTNGKTAFINFPQNLIVNDVANFLPREKIVIEILEDVMPAEDVIKSLTKLKNKGYTIALDDFIYRDKFIPLVELTNIIKFDLKILDFTEIKKIMGKLKKKFSIEFLAEKVETIKEFEISKNLGFSYFQGYFFEKPEIIQNKIIPASQKNIMNLVVEATKKKMNFEKLQTMIKMDIGLSLRLLKLINSAYYRRAHKINTIKDAIVALGENRIIRFIMMAAAIELSKNKPDELIKISILRARMAEMTGPMLKSKFSANELFTMGLFSNADAMLGITMDNLLKEMPFTDRIKSGLLQKDNDFNCIIDIISYFEKVDWINRKNCCKNYNITELAMQNIYIDALKTADSFFNQIA